MCFIAERYGFSKILSLPFVVFWTPLVIFLIVHQARVGIASIFSLFDIWLIFLVISNATALIFDIVDIIIYFSNKNHQTKK